MMRPLIVVLLVSYGCGGTDKGETFQGESVLGEGSGTLVIDKIDRAGLPAVLLTSTEAKVDLGIFQAQTGQPFLTLRDSDNDGVFDLLTYSSLSVTGEVLVVVEDYGMDGQPNLIMNHREKKASVFYQGTWHEVIGVGSGQAASIVIDGKSLLLKDILDEAGRSAF